MLLVVIYDDDDEDVDDDDIIYNLEFLPERCHYTEARVFPLLGFNHPKEGNSNSSTNAQTTNRFMKQNICLKGSNFKQHLKKACPASLFPSYAVNIKRAFSMNRR